MQEKIIEVIRRNVTAHQEDFTKWTIRGEEDAAAELMDLMADVFVGQHKALAEFMIENGFTSGQINDAFKRNR